jgi:hypothetical protein
MAGTQIKFLKQVIEKPIFVLKRDYNQNIKVGRKSSSLAPEINDVYIHDIQEESIITAPGTKRTVNRLFVDIGSDAQDSQSIKVKVNPYSKVGWIVNEELTICMICKTTFGMFGSAKYHCHACGNLVCQQCSENQVEIYEIKELGPLRVCRLCDFGQVSEYMH